MFKESLLVCAVCVCDLTSNPKEWVIKNSPQRDGRHRRHAGNPRPQRAPRSKWREAGAGRQGVDPKSSKSTQGRQEEAQRGTNYDTNYDKLRILCPRTKQRVGEK